jgi:predicted naringenin-chalcone synthase
MMMSLAILAIGTALPRTPVTREESVRLATKISTRQATDADILPRLYEQTTIRTRYLAFDRAVVDDILEGTNFTDSPFLPRAEPDHLGPSTRERMDHYAREAPPLALEAAGRALDQAKVRPAEVTHLVTVSCTGMAAPGVDYQLVRGLGLPSTVERTNVGFMGCHGALNGVRVARGLAAAHPDGRILLVCVELCSIHYHYQWDPKRVVASSLFADGAASLVGIFADDRVTDVWKATATASCLFADSADAMSWKIGDHGFEMTLSSQVPKLIALNLRPWLETWLAGQGLDVKRVASWAVHPGGPRILSAVEEALGLEAAATADSRAVLAECGNMSSPTILFILERMRHRQAARPCVAIGFGPGLTAEVTLFE